MVFGDILFQQSLVEWLVANQDFFSVEAYAKDESKCALSKGQNALLGIVRWSVRIIGALLLFASPVIGIVLIVLSFFVNQIAYLLAGKIALSNPSSAMGKRLKKAYDDHQEYYARNKGKLDRMEQILRELEPLV